MMDAQQLKALLDRAEDPLHLVMQPAGPDGMTAMHMAVTVGSHLCMEVLLRVGRAEEQVLAADALGFNALMIATVLGKKKCVRLLLTYDGGSLAAVQGCQSSGHHS